MEKSIIHLSFIVLGFFCGYILGILMEKLPFIGIPIFIILLLYFIYLKKDKYTYWLVTVQKPSKIKNGSTIVITSSFKIKNKFITSKIINAYYNELCSETGEWNILFYSKLTKEEYDIYNSNENQNE